MTRGSDPTLQHGRGWEDTYLSKDKEEVEGKMRGLGQTWEWLPGERLRTVSHTIFPLKVDEGEGR